MAAFEIIKVRSEPARSGTHEHVEAVWLSAGFPLPRSTVLMDLRTPGGDRYFTRLDVVRTNVIATSCPHCGFRDYLTTEADTPLSNNLLDLPEF
ncbi:MAG: DUF3892 domain-containing protein [Candidatus Limnocylindria bacterium]